MNRWSLRAGRRFPSRTRTYPGTGSMLRLIEVAILASMMWLGACAKVGQMAETLELRHNLGERYRGANVEVAWVNGVRHLKVTLDGQAFRTLADSEYRPTADSIARAALGYFPSTRQLDSITVAFVVGSSGTLVHTQLSVSTTFPVSELRQSGGR